MRIVKKSEVAIVSKEEYDILNLVVELLGDIYYEAEEHGDLEDMAHIAMNKIKDMLHIGLIECEKE